MAENSEQDDRGRHSGRPFAIPRTGWLDVALRTGRAAFDDNVGLVAAGVAFYGMLAIFPGIAALISIYGLVADPSEVRDQLQAASGVLPNGAFALLSDQMTQVSDSTAGALSLAAAGGLLLALWGASRITKAFMKAMNIAYGEDEERGFLRTNLTALALTVFILLTAAVAIGGIVILPIVLDGLGLGASADRLIGVLRWPVIAAIFVGGLALLYRFGPSRDRPRWRWVVPGCLAALALWLAASIAFSVYVRDFGRYNETYGSLGAVIGMLMWLWLSAFAILLGAELNAELERQTRRDTTVGPHQPKGERGAHAADTVADRRR
ncbi:MAG: YihY family inner membrane protein [Alphaproteobacteria bacterium]|nr:YihY family inner membrane protein [Alphaproteobacteria bacterium]